MEPLCRLATGLGLLLPAAPGRGVCPVCRIFTAPGRAGPCAACRRHPRALSVVVPISYSVSGGRLHRELRAYKDDRSEVIRDIASLTVATLLDGFLSRHESCVAAAANVHGFALVTTVPSSSPRADATRGRLRAIVGACPAVRARFRRLLVPGSDPGAPHRWSAGRYAPIARVPAAAVLLVDDTWTTGANAQAAGLALRRAGATCVALVVVGRQVTPEHADNAVRVAALESYDWGLCAVHKPATGRAGERRDQPGGALAPPEVSRES